MGTWQNIPKHDSDKDCEYLKEGHCFYCCDKCNYDRHICHFCGEHTDHNGYVTVPVTSEDGTEGGWGKERHWLSDCRPDLVEHEIGDACTWRHIEKDGVVLMEAGCYAYQDRSTGEFGTEHKHFWKDGPTS